MDTKVKIINEKTDWLKVLIEIIKFRYSRFAQRIRQIHPKCSTKENILLFSNYISTQHSWYKHLPCYPGIDYYIV